MTKFSTAAIRTAQGNLICTAIHRDDAAEYVAKGWTVGEMYTDLNDNLVYTCPTARAAIEAQGYAPSRPNGVSMAFMRRHPEASTHEAF